MGSCHFTQCTAEILHAALRHGAGMLGHMLHHLKFKSITTCVDGAFANVGLRRTTAHVNTLYESP